MCGVCGVYAYVGLGVSGELYCSCGVAVLLLHGWCMLHVWCCIADVARVGQLMEKAVTAEPGNAAVWSAYLRFAKRTYGVRPPAPLTHPDYPWHTPTTISQHTPTTIFLSRVCAAFDMACPLARGAMACMPGLETWGLETRPLPGVWRVCRDLRHGLCLCLCLWPHALTHGLCLCPDGVHQVTRGRQCVLADCAGVKRHLREMSDKGGLKQAR
jgi:hypothetical protein